MAELNEQLDKLREDIQTDDFLYGKGLGNEVNIRIFCYHPDKEMTIKFFIQQLQSATDLCCTPVVFNLYDIFLDILQGRRLLDKIPNMEDKLGKNKMLDNLQKKVPNTEYVSYIKEKYNAVDGAKVLILTGVGSVFPFMRVHSILDALQPQMDSSTPILVFYPGEYNGRTVTLFNEMAPNEYYRAFKVV